MIEKANIHSKEKGRLIKRNFWKVLILILLLIPGIKMYSQFYEYGQEPGNVKWEKIESSNFKLIYPFELRSSALKTILLLEKDYPGNSGQLNAKPGKTPVILHNHTVRSNGFVIWAPRRMELFMFPDVDGISQDWYSHLTLHEFRHIAQTDKMNAGFTKGLTTILGEQGLGPAAGLTPFWLLEGDAIYAETSLSNSGRGRTPEFEMGLKAHLLEDEKPYSYSKSYLGSYIDYVPSYYEYGYQMVSFAREKYGEEFWSGAFSHIGRKPFLLNPLYFYLKKNGAGSKKELYDSTNNYIKNYWKENASNRFIEDYASLNKETNKVYTSYKSPQSTERNSAIAIKSNVKYRDRFVEILPDGSEKVLFIPGYLNSGRISYANRRILWDEFQPGIRFRNQGFSVLREYDIDSKTTRSISMNSRFTSPAYSSSGDSIVAIETSLSNDFSLVYISALDAGIFNKVSSPGNVQLMDPSWIENSDKVVMVGLSEEGKSLLIYDRSENKWTEILPPSEYQISRPVSYKNYILFNATYEGIDNIYAMIPGETEIYKVTETRYGAFEPDISNSTGELYFSDYSSKGFNTTVINLDSIEFKELKKSGNRPEQPFFSFGDGRYQPAGTSESGHEITSPEKYSKLGGLFNLHSWAPFYYDYSNPNVENPEVAPGISLLSQNLLSTAVSSISYEYKDKTHYFHTGFTYKGWVPVINFSYNYGGDPFVVPVSDSTISAPLTSTASSYSLSTYIPLNFSLGQWTLGMQPTLKLNYSSDYFYYEKNNKYLRGITYFDADFYFYFFQKAALLDLIPRWGFVFDLRSLSSPFESEQRGSITSFQSSVYLPGILRNQGIKIQNQWQKQNTERYLFSNVLSFPRGTLPNISLDLYKFTADYYIPLFYPDISIEGLIYLQRVRSKLFYDYLYGTEMRVFDDSGSFSIMDGSVASSGIEVMFDFNLFRILFPLSSGVRFSYIYNSGKIVPEFVYSIDLNRF